MIGEVIKGRYQILEILGSGGFCQTYLAQDLYQADYSKCVIKHLSTITSPQPQTIADLRHSFNREAQALEKLGKYDQIPELLAHFEIEREFYLVQQYIVGHPLSEELQTPWSEIQVVELLQDILSILDYVHEHGLIHRDIKPSNLIRRAGDRRLVLIDFGSVKQVWQQVVTAKGQTSSKFVEGIPATLAIGTPGYMPTEQGRGRPRPNSDIYAVGMIGIQALTGCSPSELLEDSDGEIIWHHATVSRRLADILDQMVRYHFKERYQSATEVLHALQPLVAQNDLEIRVNRKHNQQREQTLLATEWKPPPTLDEVDRRSPTSTNDANDSIAVESDNRLTLFLGLAIGVVSALVLIVCSYYYLRPLTSTDSSKGQEIYFDVDASDQPWLNRN